MNNQVQASLLNLVCEHNEIQICASHMLEHATTGVEECVCVCVGGGGGTEESIHMWLHSSCKALMPTLLNFPCCCERL